MDNLRDLPAIHIAQQERLGVTRIQDRRLAKVELSVSFLPLPLSVSASLPLEHVHPCRPFYDSN